MVAYAVVCNSGTKQPSWACWACLACVLNEWLNAQNDLTVCLPERYVFASPGGLQRTPTDRESHVRWCHSHLQTGRMFPEALCHLHQHHWVSKPYPQAANLTLKPLSQHSHCKLIVSSPRYSKFDTDASSTGMEKVCLESQNFRSSKNSS